MQIFPDGKIIQFDTRNRHLTIQHIAALDELANKYNKTYKELLKKQHAELNSNDDKCHVELSEAQQKYDDVLYAAANELEFNVLIDGKTESLIAAADEYKKTCQEILNRWHNTLDSDVKMHLKEMKEVMDDYNWERRFKIGEKYRMHIESDGYLENMRRRQAIAATKRRKYD